MSKREEVLQRLAVATGFRYPLRWADDRTTLGDYDGRDLTIEVFNISSNRQRAFFGELRQLRRELEDEFGRPVTFIFHTPEVTARHYAHLFAELRGAEITGILTIVLAPGGVGEKPELAGHSPLYVLLERAA